MIKKCEFCEKKFETTINSKKFCCEKCRKCAGKKRLCEKKKNGATIKPNIYRQVNKSRLTLNQYMEKIAPGTNKDLVINNLINSYKLSEKSAIKMYGIWRKDFLKVKNI